MTSRIATCWKVKLKNNKLLCFTDSDSDLFFEQELYHCGSYFTPSNIFSSNELGQDSFSISGIIDRQLITKEALLAGDFIESHLEIFLVNLDNLAEKTILKTGWFGSVKYNKEYFTAEILSVGNKTNNLIINYT